MFTLPKKLTPVLTSAFMALSLTFAASGALLMASSGDAYANQRAMTPSECTQSGGRVVPQGDLLGCSYPRGRGGGGNGGNDSSGPSSASCAVDGGYYVRAANACRYRNNRTPSNREPGSTAGGPTRCQGNSRGTVTCIAPSPTPGGTSQVGFVYPDDAQVKWSNLD